MPKKVYFEIDEFDRKAKSCVEGNYANYFEGDKLFRWTTEKALNYFEKDFSIAADDGIDRVEHLVAGLLVDVDAVAVPWMVHQRHLPMTFS